MKKFNLGIDIGGTFIRTGLISSEGKLSEFQKISSENLTPNSLVESINDVIKGRDNELQSISIGVPATVSKDKKKVLSATFLHALDKVNIVDLLEETFSCKVYLDKDVNFLLYRDIERFQLKKQNCVCGIYFGTGIGCSVYIHQKFLVGKNGVAGELGHIPVYKNIQQCGCGNIGCLEALACGKKLHQLYQEKYNEEPFENIFIAHQNNSELGEFIYGLSLSVATIVNIFDPDTIILGGGVLNISGFPKPLFEKHIYEKLRKPYPHDDISIIYTNDSQECGVLGGGLFAWSQNK